jgi:aryl sulfotransferase
MTHSMARYASFMDDNARWQGFTLRPGDIIISTPPKCGTTWMQMICALLVFQSPTLPRRLAEISPWMEGKTLTAAEVHDSLRAQQHRRFIKSHTPLAGLPWSEEITYVCVGRDPRDAAVSFINHKQNANKGALMAALARAAGPIDSQARVRPPASEQDMAGEFWNWVDDDSAWLGSLQGMMHHLDTFWQQRNSDNVVLVHFDDLRNDLEGQMRRLAEILCIDVPETSWPSLVAAASFQEMRARAEELVPDITIEGYWKDPTLFFRHGAGGLWRSFMDSAGLTRYRARISEVSQPDLANWVHRDDWEQARTDRAPSPHC